MPAWGWSQAQEKLQCDYRSIGQGRGPRDTRDGARTGSPPGRVPCTLGKALVWQESLLPIEDIDGCGPKVRNQDTRPGVPESLRLQDTARPRSFPGRGRGSLGSTVHASASEELLGGNHAFLTPITGLIVLLKYCVAIRGVRLFPGVLPHLLGW